MTAQAQRRAQEQPVDQAWELARRWPALRGEAKLAWIFLWSSLCFGREATIVVTATAVGEDQGTSTAAGLRALKGLAQEGLIEVIERNLGRWTVFVPHPDQVRRARRARVDSQAELFPDEDTIGDEHGADASGALGRKEAASHEAPAESLDILSAGARVARRSADPTPHPPPLGGSDSTSAERSSQPERALACAHDAREDLVDLDSINSLRDLVLDLDLEDLDVVDQPAAEAEPDPPSGRPEHSLADCILAYEPATPGEASQAIVQMARSIYQRVADPRLRVGVCLRIAYALWMRRIKRAEIARLLGALDKHRRLGTLRSEPFAFVAVNARARFAELGVPYELPPAGLGLNPWEIKL